MIDTILFTVFGRPFSIPDVLHFADSQGLLEPARVETGEGLASRQYALELGFELDAGQLQNAVEAWRYGRELTSARETMTWLGKYGLSVDDLSDHFETSLWRTRFWNERQGMVAEYPPAREDVERRLGPAVIITGQIRELARNLAWRAAALMERRGAELERPVWDLLADMETSFREVSARIVTEENCRGEVARSRFALIQVECEAALFTSRDEAQEAAFCVRADGEELEAVSTRASAPLERSCRFVDNLPPEVRDVCISATPGEVFVVPQLQGGFQVVRLVRKLEPDLADEAVGGRVRNRLLEASFLRLEAQHVQWKDQ